MIVACGLRFVVFDLRLAACDCGLRFAVRDCGLRFVAVDLPLVAEKVGGQVSILRTGVGGSPTLINWDNGRLVAGRVRTADNFAQRLKGLMGAKRLPSTDALLLENCSSIHTFFMRFPIDVAFLDRDLRIVGTFPNVKPWGILCGVKGAVHTLELASGVLKATGTEVGHRLDCALGSAVVRG